MNTELFRIAHWIFVVLFVIISYLIINVLTDNTFKNNHQSNESVSLTDHFTMIKGNLMLQFSSDGHKMINVDIGNDGHMKIQDIVKIKPRLVFRFSSDHCITCLEAAMEALQLLIDDEFEFDNMVFLPKYHNKRAYNIFLKDNNINVNIYNVTDDLEIPAEKFGVPYFFVLMPDLTTLSTFIPAKELEQYTYQSLRTIFRSLNTLLSKNDSLFIGK